MERQPAKGSPELRAAIELQNKANRIAKVESKKSRRLLRIEANKVRRELKHDAGMTSARRVFVEKVRQVNLALARAAQAANKRKAEILKGTSPKETKTELGVIIPSGAQVGKIVTGARGKSV